MEGGSFAVPGRLPNRWHTHGPPNQFQGYHQNMHSPQAASANQPSQCSSNYQNHYSNSHNVDYSSKDAMYSNDYNNQFFGHHQGGPMRQQRQWHQYAMQQRKPITCGPCNRTFYSQQKMDEHLNDHVDCPFPECKLSAHIKVIDQHINNQHMLVNFEALQIDDETWIAERKKRFPTAKRAELRRAEQMEKLKRGEKLGINKKPFDKTKGDKNFKKGRNGMQKGNTGKKVKQNEASSSSVDVGETSTEGQWKANSRFKKRRRDERPPGPRKPSIVVDLFELSDEEVQSVRPFKGTKRFYESTGEMNYFSTNNVKRNSVESDIAISDEEEWETENKGENANTGALVLGGALGSLMGAYSDSEDENTDTPALKFTASNESVNSSLKMPVHNNKNICVEKKDNGKHCGERELAAKARRRPRVHKKGKGMVNVKKPRTRRRRTLLERLLQADIIHERNIILQCVHFIVENNFFDESVNCDNNIELQGSQEVPTLGQEKLEKKGTVMIIRKEESSVTEFNSLELNKETDITVESVNSKDSKHESCYSAVEKLPEL